MSEVLIDFLYCVLSVTFAVGKAGLLDVEVMCGNELVIFDWLVKFVDPRLATLLNIPLLKPSVLKGSPPLNLSLVFVEVVLAAKTSFGGVCGFCIISASSRVSSFSVLASSAGAVLS